MSVAFRFLRLKLWSRSANIFLLSMQALLETNQLAEFMLG